MLRAELRFLLTPTNTIQALHGYLRNKWSTPVVVAPFGRDAMKGQAWAGQKRRTVTILVVGETARDWLNKGGVALAAVGRDLP